MNNRLIFIVLALVIVLGFFFIASNAFCQNANHKYGQGKGVTAQVLADTASAIRADFPAASSGDIEGVTAGVNITGGGTSGTVTVNADTSAGNTKLATQGDIVRDAQQDSDTTAWDATKKNLADTSSTLRGLISAASVSYLNYSDPTLYVGASAANNVTTLAIGEGTDSGAGKQNTIIRPTSRAGGGNNLAPGYVQIQGQVGTGNGTVGSSTNDGRIFFTVPVPGGSGSTTMSAFNAAYFESGGGLRLLAPASNTALTLLDNAGLTTIMSISNSGVATWQNQGSTTARQMAFTNETNGEEGISIVTQSTNHRLRVGGSSGLLWDVNGGSAATDFMIRTNAADEEISFDVDDDNQKDFTIDDQSITIWGSGETNSFQAAATTGDTATFSAAAGGYKFDNGNERVILANSGIVFQTTAGSFQILGVALDAASFTGAANYQFDTYIAANGGMRLGNDDTIDNGTVSAGSDAFTTTATTDTVTIAGAANTDLYWITLTGAGAPSANDLFRVEATSTGFVIHRSASGTSGLTYNWKRELP